MAWIVQAKVLIYSQIFPGHISAFPLMFISSIPPVGATNDDKALEIVSLHIGQSPFADKPVFLWGAHGQGPKSTEEEKVQRA